MRRLGWLSLVVWAVAASAGGKDTIAEANEVLAAFTRGEMTPTQAANRIDFLGAQRFATVRLADALKKPTTSASLTRAAELLAAVAVPDPDAEYAFLNLLQMEDVTLRMTAARGLARCGSAGAAKPLEKALGDKALGVRREAAKALGKLGRRSSGRALIAAVRVEDDPETRMLMLLAVGGTGDAKQEKALKEMLASSSESTRLAATRALCLLGLPSGFAEAKKLLVSAQPSERLQGVLLFEGVSARATKGPLGPMLADADVLVRATAARVMAQGGDSTKVEWLVLESFKAAGEGRLPYETQLEQLRLTDEDRARILKRAGLK